MFNQEPSNTRLSDLAASQGQPTMMAANNSGRFQPQEGEGMLPSAMDASQYRNAYREYAIRAQEEGESPMSFEEFVRTVQGA